MATVDEVGEVLRYGAKNHMKTTAIRMDQGWRVFHSDDHPLYHTRTHSLYWTLGQVFEAFPNMKRLVPEV